MDVGRQAAGSNDCGVWVCKWMNDCHLSNNYNIKVDRGTRMRLAIDLVIKPYNIKKEQVVSEASAEWKNVMRRGRQPISRRGFRSHVKKIYSHSHPLLS
ncbi:hypothetical protein SESBI_40401 [Sesbania bispinosa]|nr:hypothetical protein SESBI_40401 [Sesbania bispinosa]